MLVKAGDEEEEEDGKGVTGVADVSGVDEDEEGEGLAGVVSTSPAVCSLSFLLYSFFIGVATLWSCCICIINCANARAAGHN